MPRWARSSRAQALRAHRGLHRDRRRGRREAGGRRPRRSKVAGPRERLLHRRHAVRPRDADDAHLQGRDLRPGAVAACACTTSPRRWIWSTRTSSATAWPASRATATSRASSRAASRSAWSASTCRSRCRWPGTASAAGSAALFGDMHAYGEEGVRFYTKQKIDHAALAREHRQGRGVRDADVEVTVPSGAAARPSGADHAPSRLRIATVAERGRPVPPGHFENLPGSAGSLRSLALVGMLDSSRQSLSVSPARGCHFISRFSSRPSQRVEQQRERRQHQDAGHHGVDVERRPRPAGSDGRHTRRARGIADHRADERQPDARVQRTEDPARRARQVDMAEQLALAEHRACARSPARPGSLP